MEVLSVERERRDARLEEEDALRERGGWMCEDACKVCEACEA